MLFSLAFFSTSDLFAFLSDPFPSCRATNNNFFLSFFGIQFIVGIQDSYSIEDAFIFMAFDYSFVFIGIATPSLKQHRATIYILFYLCHPVESSQIIRYGLKNSFHNWCTNFVSKSQTEDIK